jgi:ubiquitin thioesterase protein OTUB1
LVIAVAFGYFENLLNLRDAAKAQQELARIKSMNRLLDQVGHQEYLYETFVDATEEAFNQVIDSINKGVPDEGFLVNIFNDFNESMSIITHFRVHVFSLLSYCMNTDGCSFLLALG